MLTKNDAEAPTYCQLSVIQDILGIGIRTEVSQIMEDNLIEGICGCAETA